MLNDRTEIIEAQAEDDMPLLSTSSRSAATLDSKSSKERSNPYRDTLLLPKTEFPLRADAPKREKLFRERSTESLYKWQWAQKDRPLFVLHDGPPYANGNLHIGDSVL
jgi:isoleucyl-tRNA synthetase